ncbi:MAG: cobyrinate a,c-diamide synthase [Bacillota bacterium]|nr:cobyrinate a,c-diamide synthase [Bacillota bacterium]
MKLIQITAPSSNSGKTITSSIIARALINSGLDLVGFKCGPDFIDSKYLAFASKRDNGNLDLHLMGQAGMKAALALNQAAYGLVEGAMGYFDGIGIGYESSAYDIGRKLDLPAILVYKAQGEMFSIIPKVKGMVDFSQGRIKAIIFSATSKAMFPYLKKMVEDNLDIKVLGYIEKTEDLNFPSRNLGLMAPEELEEFDQILDDQATKSLETIDYKALVDLMVDLDLDLDQGEVEKSPYTIAIAKDQAFSFHYGENLKLFEKYFTVKYFSPLRDQELPEADLVYIDGGYPELFLDELSSNKAMLESLRAYIEEGGHYLGQGAGLIYLTQALEGRDLVGIFPSKTVMNKRLQNFGYVYLNLEADLLIGKKGARIPAHEFHYSSLTEDLEGHIKVEKASKTKSWSSGYLYKNALGLYQHINFSGNQEVIDHIIKNLGEKNVYK